MAHEYKNIIGLIAVIIAFVSYVPYFRNIFIGKTKPHAFTWLVWGVLNAIAFAGQVHGNGGAGAWSVGFTALVMFIIFSLALIKGEKHIKTFDWLCLLGAAIALIPWFVTNDPLLSIILITLIDALGFLPTVRKSYKKPYQETVVTFSLSVLKYGLVIIALDKYSLVTYLFPASLVVMNALFVAMVLMRRKQLRA